MRPVTPFRGATISISVRVMGLLMLQKLKQSEAAPAAPQSASLALTLPVTIKRKNIQVGGTLSSLRLTTAAKPGLPSMLPQMIRFKARPASGNRVVAHWIAIYSTLTKSRSTTKVVFFTATAMAAPALVASLELKLTTSSPTCASRAKREENHFFKETTQTQTQLVLSLLNPPVCRANAM